MGLNSNCDKTQIVIKVQLWQRQKKQIMATLNCDNTQSMEEKKNCDQSQIITNLKLWLNSNCDKILNVTKFNRHKNQIVKKNLFVKKSNHDRNSNCQQSQILVKLKYKILNCGNLYSDKTKCMIFLMTYIKLWQSLKCDKTLFVIKLRYIYICFTNFF